MQVGAGLRAQQGPWVVPGCTDPLPPGSPHLYHSHRAACRQLPHHTSSFASYVALPVSTHTAKRSVSILGEQSFLVKKSYVSSKNQKGEDARMSLHGQDVLCAEFLGEIHLASSDAA